MHNRLKRNKAPAEAFSGDEYAQMRQRAQILPPNKRWRFEHDAMEKFDARTDNGEKAFLARQLNETKHLAVMARKYLVSVCNREHGVRIVTGQMTSLLRQRFGLNNILSTDNHKNRDDHRHHAIDACVIGIIDTWILQEIANQAENYENKNELSEITKRFPEPFRGMPRGDFRDRVKAKVADIIVSHKPEHGTGGALHEQTSYGINESQDKVEGDLIRRKPIEALSAKEIDKIRDHKLRAELQKIRNDLLNKNLSKKDFEKELAISLKNFGSKPTIKCKDGKEHSPIHNVRILIKEAGYISIKDRQTGQPYRAVIAGENHHIDVVEDYDGILKGVATTIFEANQENRVQGWRVKYPLAKFVMRIHKGDLIQIKDDDGIARIKKVVRLEIKDKRIRVAGHNEAGTLQKRHEDPDDPFRWDAPPFASFKERNCKLYKIDELGKPRK